MSNDKKVVIVVENSFIPLDVRVWYEATTLRDHGWQVTVICPAPSGVHAKPGLSYETNAPVDLDGISVHYFRVRTAKEGFLGYLVEYLTAFIAIWRRCWRVWRRAHFDILHICNPPDMLFPLAWFYRFLGAGIVFDHHDLFPEFVGHRFRGWPGTILFWLARWMETLTHQSAHVTMTVNQSYGRMALERGRVCPENLFIVRNGPKAQEFTPVEPEPALKRGFPILVSYVGIMGHEDGILEMIESIRWVVNDLGRRDLLFVLLGDGATRARALQNLREWGLEGHVEMPGMVSDKSVIRRYLSTSDICLSPEPLTPLNARSTFIKVGEYMALGKPIVAYDLAETRHTAGEAAIYVNPGDIAGFGQAIASLADAPEQRKAMGAYGRKRFLDCLNWERQVEPLLCAYERARRAKTNGADD